MMMHAITSLFAAAALVGGAGVALGAASAGQAVDHSKMDHSKMDHSKMDHSKMDHSKMDHSEIDESKMDHSKMDHAPVKHVEMVAARRAAFKLSAVDFLGIKAAIARGDDVKTLAFAAGALAGWGKVIPVMFPSGSTTPESEALPEIWSDRAGFEAAAANMAAASAKLAELAKAGDTAGFATQFGEVGKSCGACHTKFRKPEPKN